MSKLLQSLKAAACMAVLGTTGLAASATDPVTFMADSLFYTVISDSPATVKVISTTSAGVTWQYHGTVNVPQTVTYNNVDYAVTELGNSAFEGCTAITALTLPEGLTTIGDKAFYNCGPSTNKNDIGTLTIPSTVTVEGIVSTSASSSFSRVNFGTVILPDSWESLPNYLFQWSSSLYHVHFPANLKSIGQNCFWASRLMEADLPATLTILGSRCFARTSLESISVDANNPNFSSENGYLMSKNGTSLYYAPQTVADLELPGTVTKLESSSLGYYNYALRNLTLPEGVTEMAAGALYSANYLESITFPSTMTTIGNNFGGINNAGYKLKTITCKSTNPPTSNATWSDWVKTNCTLKVPDDAIAAYKTSQAWMGFGENIIGIVAAGVDEQAMDRCEGTPVYYDLSGRQVAAPTHGVYIRLQAGKVSKVVL